MDDRRRRTNHAPPTTKECLSMTRWISSSVDARLWLFSFLSLHFFSFQIASEPYQMYGRIHDGDQTRAACVFILVMPNDRLPSLFQRNLFIWLFWISRDHRPIPSKVCHDVSAPTPSQHRLVSISLTKEGGGRDRCVTFGSFIYLLFFYRVGVIFSCFLFLYIRLGSVIAASSLVALDQTAIPPNNNNNPGRPIFWTGLREMMTRTWTLCRPSF